MIRIRRAAERGHADHGWLRSAHSFSFADYVDPAHMGWGNLRVINEDRIAPATGFGRHGHRDMEIISYVLSGALAHEDSMGHVRTLEAGEVQRMSAGSGVMHSEFNHRPDAETHFLQIWILPDQTGIAPDYEQRRFEPEALRGRLQPIVSPDGREGSLRLNADATLYAGRFGLSADGTATAAAGVGSSDSAELALDPARKAYVHLVRGEAEVNGQALKAGDAVLMSGESGLWLQRARDAELLVFDLRP